MSDEKEFDVVVIGSGPGGYVAAIRAAQLGFKTACVEKWKTLGGTCLNIGCIPSKALLDSSEHFLTAKTKMQKHGVMVSDVKLDLPQMLKRKDSVVRQLTGGIAGLFKKHKIEWLQGHGKLAGKDGEKTKVEVLGDGGSKQTYTAKRVILATGSEPINLPFIPFDGKRILSSTEALSIPEVPKSLVVIGGGVIGLELGSVWLRLGAKVTVIEFQDRILGGMDAQMSKELQKMLIKQGFEFRLSSKCLGAKAKGDWLVVEAEDLKDGSKFNVECDYVLVATGRKPYTENLGLDTVGIQPDAKGRVKVDQHFQTSASGIYAIGDIIAGPMLAHKAEDEGIAAAEIIAGQAGHVNYEVIPGVVYTWPELASVGATEEELKEGGIEYKVGSFPFIGNGRAKAMEEPEGLVKILADAKTDQVLGFHILGPRASDMIAEGVMVMEFGGTAEDIARSCHAHPTLPEAVREAALNVEKRQIHI
ncbi:dihydrolipoyl dehydrogenase [bacterium]|jgi:dihydrolipoamide dehydrogenase|nr:dihydrolipoyl dehydrogenase [bacterium]